MKKALLIAAIALHALSGCSESDTQASTEASGSFATLPADSKESAVLSGEISFWMHEGDAGCYGTITDGVSEVQLWTDVDTCGEKEYSENQRASVEVTFRSDNQYGPGTTYTITKFL